MGFDLYDVLWKRLLVRWTKCHVTLLPQRKDCHHQVCPLTIIDPSFGALWWMSRLLNSRSILVKFCLQKGILFDRSFYYARFCIPEFNQYAMPKPGGI